MNTIWKFELRETDVQRVRMPAGARLLSVQGQLIEEWYEGGNARRVTAPMLWAQVDTDAPTVERLIAIVGTGNPAPAVDDEDSIYVGSAICGPFVWHVFDGGENHAV